MVEAFRNAFWVVEHDLTRRVVRVRRTEQPYPTLDHVRRSLDGVDTLLDSLGRPRLGLVVDLRVAAMRNDPGFEKAAADHPVRVCKGFARVAILVRTAVGKLQIQRSQRGKVEAEVFLDEDAALEYVTLRRAARN